MTLIYLNPTKRVRAVDELKREAMARGEKKFVPTEEQIQEKYLGYGGLIKDEVTAPTLPTLDERVKKLEEAVFTVATKVFGKPKKEKKEEVVATVEDVK